MQGIQSKAEEKISEVDADEMQSKKPLFYRAQGRSRQNAERKLVSSENRNELWNVVGNDMRISFEVELMGQA